MAEMMPLMVVIGGAPVVAHQCGISGAEDSDGGSDRHVFGDEKSSAHITGSAEVSGTVS
jgi:hypothetical protein